MATTTERGYGWAHQQVRAQLLPHAWGQPCPLCDQTMEQWHDLDLHHVVPCKDGGQGPRVMTHAACNRSHGQSIATPRAHVPRPAQTCVATRDW